VIDDPLSTVTRIPAAQGRRGDLLARLRAVHPRGLEWVCALGTESTVVGRTADAGGAGPLRHDTVSRSHFEVRWDAAGGTHVGRDLGSHNGSRVDGVPLGTLAAALDDGSVLQLGDVTLVYETAPAGVLSQDGATPWPNIPGDSFAANALRTQVLRAAADPSPVLLIGETGTGKEFVTRELHARSGRRGPLLSINCASLSAQLVDSQLFGHVRGSFTGATTDAPGLFRAADGGTLFLDEVGEIPLELQAKLLRVLQEGEVQPVGASKVVAVDVRVIAATNRPLERAVEAGAFRRDLYARLSLWEIGVPALSERRGDLLGWIDRLAQAWAHRRGTTPLAPWSLDPEVTEALLLRRWGSNLREVDRLVHALATSLGEREQIGRSDLPAWFHVDAADPADAPEAAAAGPRGVDEGRAVAKPPVPSREEFVEVFERLGGSVRALAKHFDRDRRQIYRWIDSYGLRRDVE